MASQTVTKLSFCSGDLSRLDEAQQQVSIPAVLGIFAGPQDAKKAVYTAVGEGERHLKQHFFSGE